MYHVEIYSPDTDTSYYLVNREDLVKLQIYHPEIHGTLMQFSPDETIDHLFDTIRQDVERLIRDLADNGNTSRLVISVFKFKGNVKSFTRPPVEVIAKYSTGDTSYINGELQPLKFQEV